MIILGIIAILLIGLNAFLLIKFHEKERTYINAIMSKDVHEFTASEVAQKPAKKKEVESDLIPEGELDDDQFYKAISKSVE